MLLMTGRPSSTCDDESIGALNARRNGYNARYAEHGLRDGIGRRLCANENFGSLLQAAGEIMRRVYRHQPAPPE